MSQVMSCSFTIHIDELVGLEVPIHNGDKLLWILMFKWYYWFWKCPLIFEFLTEHCINKFVLLYKKKSEYLSYRQKWILE